MCCVVLLKVMDGLECARQIRGRELTSPSPHFSPFIIAHSADTTPEAQQRCIHAGCNLFLVKPVVIENLVACLQAAYQHQLQQKERQTIRHQQV